jgi:predicted HTH transcriptional regulator
MIVRLTYREIERRLNAGLGEDETLEFKPHLFKSRRGFKNPVLRGVVALANASGGNLIIGLEQKNAKWDICGTSLDEEYVRNWLSQVIYDYVEPDGLPFKVYRVESTSKNLKCVGIEVSKSKERYFAVRYSGRSSRKDSSYYFPLRVGESSRLLDFHSFLRSVFSNWIIGLSTISQASPFLDSTFSETIEFDLEKFKMRIDELKSIKSIGDSETENTIRTELEDSLPYLPQNDLEPWDNSLRNATLELIDLLLEELKTGKKALQQKILKMLYHIAYRADKKTLERIRFNFLDLLEKLYGDLKTEKSSELIRLLQIMHYHQPKYIKKMIDDAIERWNKTDFDSRYDDIDLNAYLGRNNKRLKELRLFLLKSLAKARKAQNVDKMDRLQKLYSTIRSR